MAPPSPSAPSSAPAAASGSSCPSRTTDLLVLRPLGGTRRRDHRHPPRPRDGRAGHLRRRPTRPTSATTAPAGCCATPSASASARSAGPFRSFGRIAVEPRPYQLVPLLMALRLDPVRLLIADDVGIGKTIEACLIARELLDRGEVERLAVLCPPHLAEQWQRELREKFHIEAELVLPGTAAPPRAGLRRRASRSSTSTRTSSSRPTSSSPTAAARTSCAPAPSS